MLEDFSGVFYQITWGFKRAKDMLVKEATETARWFGQV